MKTKFISVILSVAVILGLMLVPMALPSAVSADPVNEWAFEIQYETVTKVTPGDSFTVNVTAVQCGDGVSNGWEAYVRYDPTYLSVSAIDIPSTLPSPNDLPPLKYPASKVYGMMGSPPSWNDTEGIAYNGYSTQADSPDLDATFWFCTIHFDTQAGDYLAETNLTFEDVDTGHRTLILKVGTPVQDWAKFVNGTVLIGTPSLEVCVDPVGTGSVEADETLLVMDVLGCNTTSQAWSPPPVSLEAFPVDGWAFQNWTGDLISSENPDDVTIDALTQSVTAHFYELPPKLSVDPLSLPKLSARFGDNTDSGTVTISNTGGHHLNWTIGSPPEWNCSWVWNNTYWDGANGTPVNNTVTLTVTGSDADNYAADIVFSQPMNRVLNISNPAYPYDPVNESQFLYPPASMLCATVLVDKYSLDYVQQAAELSVTGFGPCFATMDYNVIAGDAGWPYNVGDQWTYTVDVLLYVPGVPMNITEPQKIIVAAVTNYTDHTASYLGGTPLGMWCYETTHALNGVTPFMWTYYNDSIRNFVVTIDGGTYNAPPVDVRSLLGFTPTCPGPIQPPDWVSFDKTSGSLGIGDSKDLIVTANASGLSVTPEGEPYPFNFTISAPGSIQEETVEGTFAVLTAETIDVTRTIKGTSVLGKPGETTELYPGETFEVYVDFDVPVPEVNLNAIGLTDLAPAGWEVEVNPEWCADPKPYAALATGNKAEYLWSGGTDKMPSGSHVSAMYKVTVPTTATEGTNSFANETEMDKAWLEYYFELSEAFKSPILGNPDVTVTVPGDIVGLTRDVNHDDLSNVDVTIYRVTDGIVLIQYPNGVAEWSTDQNKSGKFSVYLEAGTPGGASRIQLQVDPIAIADFSGASFFVREPEGIVHGGEFPGDWNIPYPYGDPYINILLDTNHDGVSDDKLEGIASTPSPPTVETWTEMVEAYGFYTSEDTICGLVSPCAAGPVYFPEKPGDVWRIPDAPFTLADWQAWFADNSLTPTVVGVQITFGWWLDDPVEGVYVDDITINGITYDLESSKVALRGDSSISSPDYIDTAYVTGQYSVVASKARFYDIDIADMEHLAAKYIDLGDEYKLADGATFNFSGDYGLVPRACDMSYAMKSVNLWVMHDMLPDEWGLSFWKAKDSIHSWQFPS